MIPGREVVMLNGIKKSVKISLARVYNNTFNSKLKKDLFNLSDALETASKEAGSPIVAQVKGAFIYIKDRMIYIYTESGSGYGFGIDLVRSFDDFTKGFNKYKRRAIEKSLNDILESNKYYPTKDPKHELDSWIKSIF